MEALKRFVAGTWFYHLAVFVFTTYVRIFHGLRIHDAAKVPPAEGTGLVVACNHISAWDPPVVGVSVPREINFMAKIELFESRWSDLLMAGLRAFPVDRSRNDIGAIKEAMRRLKEGRAIGIFAQGTRNAGAAEAFDGAAFIAQRAGVPLQPAAVWREGRVFHVRFGDPLPPGGRSRDEVRAATAELMQRINALLPEGMASISDEEIRDRQGPAEGNAERGEPAPVGRGEGERGA